MTITDHDGVREVRAVEAANFERFPFELGFELDFEHLSLSSMSVLNLFRILQILTNLGSNVYTSIVSESLLASATRSNWTTVAIFVLETEKLAASNWPPKTGDLARAQ